MEPINILQRIVKKLPDASAPTGLNIISVYQDIESRVWIGDLWNRVAELAGPDAVPITAWSLDELSHAPAFREAVSAAALADVLVISINAGEQLPSVLCAWIAAWLPRRQRRDGVLITLLGVAAGQPDVRLAQAKEYLGAMAGWCGLDFMFFEHLGTVHHSKTSASDKPSFPETNSIHQPERSRT